MGVADPTTQMLKQYKESWNDKLKYKKYNFRNSLREPDD